MRGVASFSCQSCCYVTLTRSAEPRRKGCTFSWGHLASTLSSRDDSGLDGIGAASRSRFFGSRRRPQGSPIEEILQISGKNIGQVLFLNDSRAGYLVLGSLLVLSPATFPASIPLYGFLGSMASTIVSKYILLPASIQHKLDVKSAVSSSSLHGAYQSGLLGYNGFLIGALIGTPFFGCPQSTMAATTLTITGATMATYGTALWPRIFPSAPPQVTYVFNLLGITCLMPFHPLAAAASDIAPISSSSLVSPLTSLGQIFFAESALAGCGLLLAVASYSPALANYTLAGSAVGCAVSAIVMPTVLLQGISSTTAVATGLYGYNAALTAMFCGVFFKNRINSSSYALPAFAMVNASMAAVLHGLMATGLLSSTAAAVPCLSLPFCLTSTASYFLVQQSLIPNVILAVNPHSPEKNY
jgi:urea transporter